MPEEISPVLPPDQNPDPAPPPLTPQKPYLTKGKFLQLIIFLVIAVALIVANFVLSRKKTDETLPTAPSAVNPSVETSNTVANLTGTGFASFQETKSATAPALPAYTLKSSDLVNLNVVAADSNTQFSVNQLDALEKSGFFTLPVQPAGTKSKAGMVLGGGRYDDMVNLYTQIGGSFSPVDRKPENTVFVTTDFMLHIYHVLVDKTFQNIEETKFHPDLTKLTETLFTDALSHYQSETDPQFKSSWERLAVFYLVPKTILNTSQPKSQDYFGSPETEQQSQTADESVDLPAAVLKNLEKQKTSLPSGIYSLAKTELEYVMAGKDFGIPSPTFGSFDPTAKEDYTQYTPRSHYTKNSVLRSYFRAMMWYGRHGFTVQSPDLTRDALLVTWQLTHLQAAGKPALGLWENIYLPTVFFVGKSDDLSVYEYSGLFTKIYGKDAVYADLKNPQKTAQFAADVKKLEGPKILSDIKLYTNGNVPTKEELLKSTQGFRFMGQRFIPDSYMFSTLTQGDEPPDPETGQKLPSTPTALMVMSILGSKTADSLLTDWINTNASQSDKVIAKVKNQLVGEFAKFDQNYWTQNIYWTWLFTLKPLLTDYGAGYPMFMQNSSWSKKSLTAALGSWTELRHDTLLYAKQSYAEMGGGPPDDPTPPPVPKGYVEPNLDFLTRLIALAKMTSAGLEARGLMPDVQKFKFTSFIEDLKFFQGIAEQELADKVISDSDYERLRKVIGQDFNRIVSSPDGDVITENDARTGLIADVHTDVPKGQILYEATGIPSVIYVAVKDKGGTRLTRGVVYTYYEFSKPLGARLTDQIWQGMAYDGKDPAGMPSMPVWTVHE